MIIDRTIKTGFQKYLPTVQPEKEMMIPITALIAVAWTANRQYQPTNHPTEDEELLKEHAGAKRQSKSNGTLFQPA